MKRSTTVITLIALPVLLVSATALAQTSVDLETADDYSVLAATTVTNIGDTVLNQSLGLSSGTDITGFPPGIVNPPGVIEQTTPAAAAAQLDLTAAYIDAAGRPLNETVTSDLTGLTLVGGVYAGPSKSPLSLAGDLTLDGAGDPNSVFIFQTDSTLITGSGSTVTLINGAQQCNVFWQVGSSATLGTGSTFVGTILALTSISVDTGVTVQGRALARNGAVTLDTDTFNAPTCDTGGDTTTPGGDTSTPTPLTPVTPMAPPVGGVATGGGSTAGAENLGLLVAGGALLAGAVGAFAVRRRVMRKGSSS